MSDCAILAIASTTQTVRELLQRLVKNAIIDEQTSVVPWTIVNKYYIAEVRFLVHTISSWTTFQDEFLAPAILFVWNRGEPYRDHIRKISQHASQHEFEVALAIRLPYKGVASSAEVDDDHDIDAYLSSKGFEFVDVPDIESPSLDRSGILGIPRVVDALSTIMWSSMIRQPSKRVTVTGSKNPGVSPDNYHNLVRLVGEKISGDHMQRELEELGRWLEEDTLSGDADMLLADGGEEGIPWSTVVTPGTLSPSSGFLENSRPSTPQAGFDDDFTSFVSASPSISVGVSQHSLESLSSPQRSLPLASTSFGSTFSFSPLASGYSTPTFDDHPSPDMMRLAPGESYKSLGSVSDLGDPDKNSMTLDHPSASGDGVDDDVPSQAEIAETSRRIFGIVPLSLSPAQERGEEIPRVLPASSGAPLRDYQEADVEMTDGDVECFDLQSVLGALQGLKEEIAGMPDKERRKAAARVALGLVYGLGNSQAGERV